MRRKTPGFTIRMLACLASSIGLLHAAAPWRSLFDGETLEGWVQRGGKARYAVEDGTIVGTTVPNTPNSFLCTEEEYGDFVLELEFLVDPGMNSGIQIRSHSYEAYRDGRVHGYQVEIDPSPRAWTGGIYDEARRGWLDPLKDRPAARKAFKQGEWNRFRIEAIGARIRTWLNGVPAADLRDDMTARGFIALQVHGTRRTSPLHVRWRHIRIQVLDRPRTIEVLLVDGQNNHDWRATTPVLKAILEDAGIFAVHGATTPENLAAFGPDFSKYDVVLSNYNGADWPEATRKAFEDYIRAGGGLVIVHAANNAFPNWKAYNEMIGLGGWGGRNEKWGPMLRFRKGRIVRDMSPGAGGSHGAQHEFPITVRERFHPIMAGLPEKWMHARDELYSTLRGPAENLTVLATAYADPRMGGTGEHEPALFTIRWGKGRIFHTILGHDVLPMRCAGFAFTLQRGTEWAATGRVTQTRIPGDFPTAERASFWLPNATFRSVPTYDFGKSRKALAAIEEATRGASPARLRAIEARLLDALQTPGCSYAGKQFVLRMLRRIGTARCVPILARLLPDPKLSHMARFALERLASDEVDRILRQALRDLEGDLRIGVIGSIGARGDRPAVPELVRLLGAGDPKLTSAVLGALGRIGGADAAAAIDRARVPRDLEALRTDAYLACADGLLDEGRVAEAAAMYGKMSAPGRPAAIRVAAYRGLVRARGEAAVPAIMALLHDRDPLLRQAAKKLLGIELRGPAATRALTGALPAQEPPAQVVLLEVLAARGDRAAAPAVARLAASGPPAVRPAALRALAVLGGASDVDLLARLAGAEGDLGAAARACLARLSGEGVDAAIARVLRRGADASVRARAIEALVARRARSALPAILEAAAARDARIRNAACDALSVLAGEEEIAGIVRLLLGSEGAPTRGDLEGVLRAIAARIEKPDAAGPVVAALTRADADAKTRLLGLLPRLAGAKALAAARAELEAADPAVKAAAIRALADWPTPEPLEDLRAIAKGDPGPAARAAALRGFVGLLSRPANRPARESTRLLEEALAMATRVEEKKFVVAALASFPCEAARKLAASCAGDPALAGEARAAARKIAEILSRRELRATASRNGGEAHLAFDGKDETRWSTNRPMRPGDWYVLDLGREARVKGIVLDTRRSGGDYPRGYEVYASFDGKSWGKPLLEGTGKEPITRLAFKEPIYTRFIKIVQTGSTQGLFWSIHELHVLLE